MKQLQTCPVCGSPEITLDYKAPTTRTLSNIPQRSWAVWQCRACTHGFVNPQPSWAELEVFYNAEYCAYDTTHGAAEDDDASVRHAQASGKLRHIEIARGKRVLDVGCGGGWFLRIARGLGAQVYGVEPSPHGADLVRKQGIDVFTGTAEQFAAQAPAEMKFDVITANHVIEHVPLPPETFEAIRKVLAPGGVFWNAVPNAAYPLCRKLKGHWHSTDLPYHLMHFTPRSMAKAGERAGLKVRAQYTESMPAAVANSIQQYLRKRWMIPGKIARRLPLVSGLIAASYARKMDAKANGEAIITEFVHA